MLSFAAEVLDRRGSTPRVNINSSLWLKRVFPVGSIDDLAEGIALVDKKHPNLKSVAPLSQEAKILFRSVRDYIRQAREKYSYQTEDPSFQERAKNTIELIGYVPDPIENTKMLLRETIVGDIVRGYGEARYGKEFRFYFASLHDDIHFQSDFIVAGLPELFENEYIRVDLKVAQNIVPMEHVTKTASYRSYKDQFQFSARGMELFQSLDIEPPKTGTPWMFLQLRETIIDRFVYRFFTEMEHEDAYREFQEYMEWECRAPLLRDSIEDRVGNIILHAKDRHNDSQHMATLRDFTVRIGELFAGLA